MPDRFGRRVTGVEGLAAGLRVFVLEHEDQRLLELVGLESVRASTVLESDLAITVDEVEPAGHAAVAGSDGIVDGIDEQREAEAEELPQRWATAARSA